MQELDWRAYFNDGRILTRKDVTYYQLNRIGLIKFELVDPQGNTVITIDATEDKKPFYRRYCSIPKQFEPFYIVGWRSKAAQKLYVIDDTGTWELSHFHDKWYEPEWQQVETPNGSQ